MKRDFVLKRFKVVIQLLVCFLPHVICSQEETQDILQSSFLLYPFSKSPHVLANNDHLLKRKELYLSEKVFQIEPSDAIDVAKYSQPAIEHLNKSSIKVPTSTPSEVIVSSLPAEQGSVSRALPKNNISKPTRDSKFIESGKNPPLSESSPEEEFRVQEKKNFDIQSDMSEESQRGWHSNNFSDHDTSLLPISSDAVLSYQIPSHNRDETNTGEELSLHVKNESGRFSEKRNSSYSSPLITTIAPPYRAKSEINDSKGVMNSTENTPGSSFVTPAVQNETHSFGTSSSSSEQEDKLSSGTVAGIVIAVLVGVTLLSSTVIYLMYKKYNGKCTSVVESKFNTDNGGYLDDSLRSSIYLNNHIELPKESSEEMSSLDNDSFLNSLETMTIQNYWADNSKNTKV